MKQIWHNWTTITKKIARVLADILLTVIYIILIIPISIALKLFFYKTLAGHNIKTQRNSYWIKRENIKYNLKNAAEQ